MKASVGNLCSVDHVVRRTEQTSLSFPRRVMEKYVAARRSKFLAVDRAKPKHPPCVRVASCPCRPRDVGVQARSESIASLHSQPFCLEERKTPRGREKAHPPETHSYCWQCLSFLKAPRGREESSPSENLQLLLAIHHSKWVHLTRPSLALGK